MAWFWDIVSVIVIVVVLWYYIQEARHANSLGRLYTAIPAAFAFGGPKREDEQEHQYEGGDDKTQLVNASGDFAKRDGWELEHDDWGNRTQPSDDTEELTARSVFDLLGLEALVRLIAEPPAPVHQDADPAETTVPMTFEAGAEVNLDIARPEGRLAETWAPRANDTSYFGLMVPAHDGVDTREEPRHEADYTSTPDDLERMLTPDPDQHDKVESERNGWSFGGGGGSRIEDEPWYNDPTDPRSPIYEAWRDDPSDPRSLLYRPEDP
ncbi:hypothetical protein FZ983_33510 [Azospirillum sp. B21]|uniref:hypothetical protein n=1 Tax=Azospirillum sp. B21 TaxID=2607496 RepID=UPI0011EF206B|nr:hypothetical protein [Azospirillum sp. B21]KAA0571308.1 hypothetical protein FZ983_33510 [Azospirillum sp. B21]